MRSAFFYRCWQGRLHQFSTTACGPGNEEWRSPAGMLCCGNQATIWENYNRHREVGIYDTLRSDCVRCLRLLSCLVTDVSVRGGTDYLHIRRL